MGLMQRQLVVAPAPLKNWKHHPKKMKDEFRWYITTVIQTFVPIPYHEAQRVTNVHQLEALVPLLQVFLVPAEHCIQNRKIG